MMTAGIAAVNDRRNTAPEFPIHECPPKYWRGPKKSVKSQKKVIFG
jgi:hypothetical protein